MPALLVQQQQSAGDNSLSSTSAVFRTSAERETLQTQTQTYAAADMERHPSSGGPGGSEDSGGGKQQQQQHRRKRSASQPVPQQPIAGPSRVPELDFGFMPHQFGPGAGGIQEGPAGYEEDAIARALLAMQQPQHQQHHPHSQQQPQQQQQQHPQGHPAAGGAVPGQLQQMQLLLQLSSNPQLMDMFVNMLPQLQTLQMQQQQQQQPRHHPQPQPPHQQTQGAPFHIPQSQQQPQHLPPPFASHARQHHDPHVLQQQQQQQQHSPFGLPAPAQQRPPSQPQQPSTFSFLPPVTAHAPDVQMSHSFMGGHFGTLPPPERPTVAAADSSMMPPPPPPPQAAPHSASNTPSPEAGHTEPTEMEAVALAEDKRRRNTAASARFRIKKKQWTLNLERTISDLSGRVEELEREAAELRRENGWLKEIVMLKSKQFKGSVPVNLEPPPESPSGPSGSGLPPSGGGGGGSGPGSRTESREGSRESSTEPTLRRRGGDEKGKGKGRQRSP